MSASLEPRLYSWLVVIPLEFPTAGFQATRNLNWNGIEANRITKIREQFTNAGFKLVEMPMDYYNPNSKRRFKAKHEHAAAMTVLLLGMPVSPWGLAPFTVVDENHYEENV